MILLFRIALGLCPPAFRREYGAAIARDFQLAFADERTIHGGVGACTYALGATWDLLATATREYAAMLFRDLTYALRALRKTPSFTAVVVATLALAIGANAAVFSILHAVVLAPLPYADAGRLVALEASLHGKPLHFSLPDYADVLRPSASSIGISAAFDSDLATMTGRGAPQSLIEVTTTTGLFETLGIRPQLGRFPASRDAIRGAARTVVITDALWRRSFAADPSAIGSSLHLSGKTYRVIGVAPRDFHQPKIGNGFQRADLWTFVPDDGRGTQYDRGYHTFNVVARSQPGATVARARAALAETADRLQRRYPADDTHLAIGVEPLIDSLVGSARQLLFATFAAVAAVLLVACANVANLLLGRAASREREFSVRIAIGASRGRIITQLLVEAFVLAIIGGTIGIGIAFGVVAAFVTFHPANIPRADSTAVDGASILYTLGVVAFCTLAAGLAPAFTSAERDVAVALKSAGRGGDAHRGARARGALVACEIAMTLALVICAGLVVRSFCSLTARPLGFDATGVTIVGEIDLPDDRYRSDAAREAFMERAVRTARTVAGVADVAWAFGVPFDGNRFGTTFTIVGRAVRPGYEPDANVAPIGSDYLRILHATLQMGRNFTDDDRIGTHRVAIVNEAFARKYFAGRSALGARIVPGIMLATDKVSPPRTIVGVVSDLRSSFTKPAEPTIYVPARQFPLNDSSLVIAALPGSDPGPAVASVITALVPLLPKPTVTALSASLGRSVATQRLSVVALCSLAFVALALSIAGVFAVVSYGVTQRTHEFGVRMALGADARVILRMVLAGAMRLAFAGISLGLIVAAAGTRLIGDQLYDVQALDPFMFGSITALVIVAALSAAFVPARRATRVDPIVALRYE